MARYVILEGSVKIGSAFVGVGETVDLEPSEMERMGGPSVFKPETPAAKADKPAPSRKESR